jgi:hypothetical protein
MTRAKREGVAVSQRKKRRFIPIVDKAIQYRFFVMILAYCVIIVVVLAAFLLVPDVLQLLNEDLSLEVRAAAADKVLSLHLRVWPAIIVLVIVFGLHSIRALHRVVGPLYRFRWAFDQVKDGNMGFRVKLRKKDYLHREEDSFNEMLEILGEKWGDVQLAGLDALQSVNDLEQQVRKVSGWNETNKQKLRELRRNLETLKKSAGYFRIKPEYDDPETLPGSEEPEVGVDSEDTE